MYSLLNILKYYYEKIDKKVKFIIIYNFTMSLTIKEIKKSSLVTNQLLKSYLN